MWLLGMPWTCQERTSCGLWRVAAAFLAIIVTLKGALAQAKRITKRPLMTSEFRVFAWITQARLTLLTYRSVIRRNIAIQAAALERPREVCPSVLHEKPTSPSSTLQALRGNDGISRARAESNIAECANERFRPPFFLCPLPPTAVGSRPKTVDHMRSDLQASSCGSWPLAVGTSWSIDRSTILHAIAFLESSVSYVEQSSWAWHDWSRQGLFKGNFAWSGRTLSLRNRYESQIWFRAAMRATVGNGSAA